LTLSDMHMRMNSLKRDLCYENHKDGDTFANKFRFH
jgi:hypothetical protein